MTNTTKKLLMFASTGLLLPLVGSVASAEVPLAAETAEVIPSPELDKGPINNGRVKRTDSEQAGNEQPTAALFDDNKSGLYFSMNTELPATTAGGQVRPATHRVQLAMVPFQLVQDATTGKVKITADARLGTFVTNNDGDEYRNSHAPLAFKLKGINKIGVKYNYQPDNSGDTNSYIKIFNPDGSVAMEQTLFCHFDNDDCGMQQDGDFGDMAVLGPNKVRLVAYLGHNGNGRDEGSALIGDIDCSAGNTCTYKAVADITLCQDEERSRGKCSIGTDPNTAFCTWTEGDTQPQRKGAWAAAINIGDGQNGTRAQQRLIWKKQLAGRTETPDGRLYAMRTMHERIQKVDATGQLVNTDDVIIRWGNLMGNNNTNGKGGAYMENVMGVATVNAAGLTYVAEPKDIKDIVVGLDGTHLGMVGGLFGTTNALVPGVVFGSGNHTGGGSSAQARVVTFDYATKSFTDAAMVAIAPHDRHLYSNYYGNNPGNQGRDHTWGTTIANPYLGLNGNEDAFLMLWATAGKSGTTVMDPARKPSAFLSVMPIAQTPKQTGGGGGSGGGGGTGGGDGGGDGDGDASGTALGGCNTGNSTGGLFGLLLVGLAAFLRRRR